MPHDIHTAQFSGPLDVLLSLLTEKKLAITEFAISEVTEHYLAAIENLEERDPDDLADFLVVATKLLILKSKSLLPQFFQEEEDEQSLEAQLKLYKQFVDASKHIARHWNTPERSYPRIEPPRIQTEVVLPLNVTQDKLHAAMLHLVRLLAPRKALPEVRIDKAVSVKEKIAQIHVLLANMKRCSFGQVITDAKNKTEIIIGFLAILELVKQRVVVLSQKETFDDIVISRI